MWIININRYPMKYILLWGTKVIRFHIVYPEQRPGSLKFEQFYSSTSLTHTQKHWPLSVERSVVIVRYKIIA